MAEGTLRIGLVGLGAIGRRVAERLRAGEVDGARLAAVLVRDPAAVEIGDDVLVTRDVDALVAACDLVVEAAGQEALAQYAPAVLAAGVDLLAVSVGALSDVERWSDIAPRTGRLVRFVTPRMLEEERSG